MSFPVLQRMDRKRPEMIQPISWQAEAMKGLASGIQTGLQIAQTAQSIKLKQAENARLEMLHGVKLSAASLEIKNLELQNKMLTNQSKVDEAKHASANIEQMIELDSIKRAAEINEYKFNAGFYDLNGNQSKWEASANKIAVDIGRGAALGSASYIDYAESLTPEDTEYIRKTAMNARMPQTMKLAEAIHPQGIRDALMQREALVEVSVGNTHLFEEDVRASMQDPNAPMPKINLKEKRPLRFGKILDYAKSGDMTQDLAKIYSDSTVDTKTVERFLKQEKFSEQRISEIVGKIEELRGKTKPSEIEFDRTTPALASQAPGAYTPIVSTSPPPVVATGTVNGKAYTVAQPKSIFESVSEGVASIGAWVRDKIENDTPEDILTEIEERAASVMRQETDPAMKVAARHAYLKRELDTVTVQQEKLARDPAQKREADKMAKVMTSLLDEVVQLESKYKIGIDAVSAQPQTKLGQDLQGVAAGGGTVRMIKNGRFFDIPSAEVIDAEKAGYERQ